MPATPWRPRLQALLLDMDGLLIDSETLYWRAEREIARAHGTQVEDSTLRRMMGRRPIESMELFRQDLGLAPDAATLLAERDVIMLELLASEVQAKAGLDALLAAFRGRALYAVVTGAPRRMVDVVLQRLNLVTRFDFIQTSDHIRRGKPDPEIYLTAMSALGLDAASCAVLEDSLNGVRAGKAAGAHVVAVPDVYSAGDDFSVADHVASDLAAAAEHLRDHFAA
ncbi:MAG: HAD family phosphatase [Pseudomonadota bacterium]